MLVKVKVRLELGIDKKGGDGYDKNMDAIKRNPAFLIGLFVLLVAGATSVFVLSKKEHSNPSASFPPPSQAQAYPTQAQTNSSAQTSVSPIPTESKKLTNEIRATDQKEGKTLYVSLMSFEKAGYLVVHRRDSQGNPGKVIGYSTLFKTGTYPNVTMALTENIKAGDVLFAMLHSDDGDGVFKFPGADNPLKDEKGATLMVKISVISASQ